MRFRNVFVVLCVAMISANGFAQGFQAQLISLFDVLTNSCSGGTPLPDGTIVKIYWDHNLNGPDAADEQPPEGVEYQQVSYNQFYMNSEGSGQGYFISQSDFTSTGALPDNPTYYLVICDGSMHWNSAPFTLVLGYQEVYFGAGGVEYNCVNSSCAGCGVPDAPTAVNATDNLCQHVLVTWSGAGTDIDSFLVRRDQGTPIARILNTGAGSWQHIDPIGDAEIHSYQVEAVRVCPDNVTIEYSPWVPGNPGEPGRRSALVPVPQQLTASTDKCDTTQFTYFLASIQGVDCVRVYRDEAVDVQVNGRLRGNAGQNITVNVLNEQMGPHDYYAVGFSFDCGESGHSNTVTGERFDQPAGVLTLTATVNLCDRIDLNWTGDMTNADSVIIRRHDTQNPPTTVAFRLPLPVTLPFQDPIAAGSYYYNITLANECGLAPTASATVEGIRLAPPAIVTNVTASDNTSCECVTVTWNPLVPEPTTYDILRGAANDVVGTVAGNVNTFCDDTAVPGTTYPYKVRANNQCGAGPISTQNNGVRGNNAGTGAVVMATPGPDTWTYTLTWATGCLSRVTFKLLATGTTGVAPTDWTVSAQVADSIVFTTLEPVGSGSVAGFQLTNTVHDTFGTVQVRAGTSAFAFVQGPGLISDAPVRPDVPTVYSLDVYPNPFNPTTTIEFGLPKAGDVHVMIFDINGRLVEDAVGGHHDAGWHRYTFDATSLSTGVYFAHIVSGNFVTTKKLMLLK